MSIGISMPKSPRATMMPSDSAKISCRTNKTCERLCFFRHRIWAIEFNQHGEPYWLQLGAHRLEDPQCSSKFFKPSTFSILEITSTGGFLKQLISILQWHEFSIPTGCHGRALRFLRPSAFYPETRASFTSGTPKIELEVLEGSWQNDKYMLQNNIIYICIYYI